ncbi:Serine/threonine protein kinase [Trema orientale]|uniref:Serine/threonine protein kinase n=1 Tax=Trema orientale TaxID=63057 RepID=A0A2P5EFF9_TREOI|nr:Serine/threonine protein kinase [Trema orientale]
MVFFNHFLVAILLQGALVVLPLFAQPQDLSGFISIDCGISDGSRYTDETTGISYISDSQFTDSGENKEILQAYRAQRASEKQFWNLRSFPEGIKNCYTLKPGRGKGTRYLIRARFLYGNYDNEDQAPTFDLYLGVDLWYTVSIRNAWTPTTTEIIHVISTDRIYVCLVNTGNGIPFMSVLELRPLRDDVYETKNGSSLALYGRFDFSSLSTDQQVLRYKDDAYDRLWVSLEANNWKPFLTTSLADDNSINKNDYQLPFTTMNTAYTRNRSTDFMYFYWKNLSVTSEYYFYMHFAELEKPQTNQTREFNIYINRDLLYGPVVPKYLSENTIYSKTGMKTDREGQITVWLNNTENSTLPPLINAMEIYILKELSQQETNQTDAEAIWNVKSAYEIEKNWQGDPCAPEALKWDGLVCGYNSDNPPRIISLDLSNNNLNGTVPEFLAQLSFLIVLNLKGNNLTGPVPDVLSEKSKNESNGDNGSVFSRKKQFTYSEILKITNNFERVLGEGGFGKVYYGNLKGNEVALKLLLRVHHKNLTTLVGYCNEETRIGLIYEYMAMGNLRSHLSGSTPNILSWEDRLRIAIDTAQGLEYLHNGCKPPIIHRDVKSTNILLNEKFQAKLGDFGVSKIFPYDGDRQSVSGTLGVSTNVVGTPGYLDPEYYASNWLNEKSDVFSFGVVLLELITARPVLTKAKENNHIIQWVSSKLANGDIENILDPRLERCFINTDTVWKAIEISMACVSKTSTSRPAMSRVAIDLKECLTAELTRKDGNDEVESKQHLIEIISQNITSSEQLTPQAR